MHKYKVTILIDPNNSWIEKFAKKIKYDKKKYIIKFSKSSSNVSNQDIVLVLSYTKILKSNLLKKNKLVLIAHPSDLPQNKGFAPVQNQMLKNKKKIIFSLIKAEKNVDSGPICLKIPFYLDGLELYDEFRQKQGEAVVKLIQKFFKKYPKVSFKPQIGKSTYNKKRSNKDYKINIFKNIKSQFNLLRICNNDFYPAYFEYKKQKFILKIYKNKKLI